MTSSKLGSIAACLLACGLMACGPTPQSLTTGGASGKGDGPATATVPDSAWAEVLQLATGKSAEEVAAMMTESPGDDFITEAQKVIVFSRGGQVMGLNSETGEVKPLGDAWGALHGCIEFRDRFAEHMQRELIVAPTTPNETWGAQIAYVVAHEFSGQRTPITPFEEKGCWYTDYEMDAQGNWVETRGWIAADDKNMFWTGTALAWDPAYAKGPHIAALVTMEAGSDCVADGQGVIAGREEIWLVDTERSLIGEDCTGGVNCDWFFKTKLVSNPDGQLAAQTAHPSWAPDNSKIVFHTGQGTGTNHLAIKPVAWEMNHGRWLPKKQTEAEAQRFEVLPVVGKNPVWIKYRDLPAQCM